MLRVAIFMSMPRRRPLKRRRGKHDGRHGAVIAPSYGGFGRRIKALGPLRRSRVSPARRRSEGATASSGVNSPSERINLRCQAASCRRTGRSRLRVSAILRPSRSRDSDDLVPAAMSGCNFWASCFRAGGPRGGGTGPSTLSLWVCFALCVGRRQTLYDVGSRAGSRSCVGSTRRAPS